MKLYTGKSAAVFLTIMAVVLIWVVQSPAEIYRWVDENGVTHFSDQKPPSSYEDKVETVDPSKLGSLSVIEGGEYKAPPTPFIENLFTPEEKAGINRNASVVIYTTAT